MATGLSAAGANTALDAFAAAYPWVKLHIGDPGATGTGNPASNTSRKQVTWAAASGGNVSNSTVITWVSVPAAEDYTHFTCWTLAAAGTFGGSGTVTANAVAVGDNFQVAIGDLDLPFPLAT